MKHRKQERGVALLFAIGIVGLMMMLLLTYATTSLTNRDVANNASSLYSARLLAESGIQRVLQVLNSYDIDCYAKLIDLRSKGTTSLSEDEEKLLYTLKNSIIYNYKKDDMSTTVKASFTKPDTAHAPQWQLVKDTNGKIVARFAYTTYRPLGLLDPFEFGTSALADGEIAKTVKKKLYEKNDFSKLDDTLKLKDLSSLLQFPSLTGNVRPYTAWDHLLACSMKKGQTYKSINPPEVTTYDEPFNYMINRYLKAPTSPFCGEYFWYSTDGTKEKAKRYCRFNLNRTDWSKFVVENKKDCYNIMDLSNLVEYKPENVGDKEKNNTMCIPWLAYGTLPEQQRQQIAANLIAFMAEVNNVDIDSSLIKDDGSNGYFANLKAPYLNEIGIKIKLQLTKTYSRDSGNPEDKNKYQITVKVTTYIELQNFFKGLSERTYEIEDLFSLFTISYPKTGDDVSAKELTKKDIINSKVKGIEIAHIGDSDKFYIAKTDEFDLLDVEDIIETINDDLELKVKLEICPGKVKLKRKNGRTEDLCILDVESLKTSYEETLKDRSQSDIWRSWQVKDARNNLKCIREITPANADTGTAAETETNWKLFPTTTDLNPNPKGGSGDLAMTLQGGTVTGNINTDTKISDSDYEKSIFDTQFAFPASINAFHPGMLGYINRGENLKTLNLGVYKNKTLFYQSSTDQHGFYINGIHKYDNGDAPLLDQLCWTENNAGYEFGKINLNMIHSSGTDTRDNTPAGNLFFVDDIDCTQFNNKSELETTDTNHQFNERMDILDKASALGLITSTDKKAEIESKLGKFIFLTTTGGSCAEADDTLYVLCVAQMIKDVGSFAGIQVPYRDKEGKIHLGTAKAGEWNENLDQVLATQRIFAILQKNNLGKWKIIRMEYVD